jgi:endoglucanase
LQAADVMIYGKKVLRGVVASTPPHLAKNGDKGKLCSVDELLIDTGYSKQVLSELVSIGTPVGFAPRYTRLGKNLLAGKGFDNKATAACALAAITEVAREELAADVYLLLSSHEETDRLGGVVCGAYRIEPDYAMVVDVNLGRTPETPKHETVELGKGSSVTLSAVTDRKLTACVCELAEQKGIAIQKIVSADSTGTNAQALGLVKGGIPVVDVGLPLKNMHTYNEVLCLDDCQNLVELIEAFICDKKTAEVFS